MSNVSSVTLHPFMKTLKELATLKKRWQNAQLKDGEDRCAKALARIEQVVKNRTTHPIRCALPKKKQRELGMLPPV